MIISIHQPSYWPWLGLLDKIAKSDLFIILDTVEISKGSFQYRNQFLCNGKAKFITLPVHYYYKTKLHDLVFSSMNWREPQLEFLRNYYLKAKYFKHIFPSIEKLYYDYHSTNACEFIINTMKKCFEIYKIKTMILKASDYSFIGQKGDLVLEICSYFKADTYLSGQGAKSYMDESLQQRFTKAGIAITWQQFVHPVYPQAKGMVEFVGGLSCLDLAFYNGEEYGQKILNVTDL